MPLIESSSEQALKQNIATEVAAGKNPSQAAAIAYSVQRANDDEPAYQPVEEITLAELAERNRKYWEQCNGN